MTGPLAVVLDAPDVLWAGRTATNPVHRIAASATGRCTTNRRAVSATHPSTGARLEVVGEQRRAERAAVGHLDRHPVHRAGDRVDGGMPVVSTEDAAAAMRSVLAIAAGVDGPDALPRGASTEQPPP